MTTLQFVQDRQPYDGLINYFSHGWPTHVDVVWDDNHLLGARAPGGVAIRKNSYLYQGFFGGPRRIARVTLPLTVAQDKAYRAFLEDQLGKPYDWAGVFSFALGTDWRKENAWYCSALAMAGLFPQYAGFFRHPIGSGNDHLTPADALLVCSAFAPVIEMPV